MTIYRFSDPIIFGKEGGAGLRICATFFVCYWHAMPDEEHAPLAN
jgi:hypothetical protein